MLQAFALFVVLLPSFAALAAARYFIARAFGIPDIRFFFNSGPNMTLEGISRWARPAILLGGAAATYLVAASLFFAVNCIAGQTTAGSLVIVLDGRPAAGAGMKTGDRVVAIGNRKIELWDELASTVRAHPGEPLDVTVERDGQEVHFTVTPGAKGEPDEGKIGVAPTMVKMGIGEALAGGLAGPATAMVETVRGAIKILLGAPENVAGPVAIAETIRRSSNPTASFLLYLGTVNGYCWPGFVVLSLLLLPRSRKKKPLSNANTT